VACCDIAAGRAAEFADRFGIARSYDEPEAFFDDPALDAVSIVTSDEAHARLALSALERRLHVLCEKPLATSVDDAERMSRAARNAGVVNMVNFSYRRSSALEGARRMVTAGRLGALRHFEAHYLQSWLVSGKWGAWRTDPKWLWRLSTAHGSGGVLGDIGVHLLDFVTFAAGDAEWVECRLKTFSKAEGDRVGDYTLDANDTAIVTLRLKNGAIGTLNMSRWATGHLNSILLSLHGDRGAVRIDLDRSYDEMAVCVGPDVEEATWKARTFKPAPSVLERFIKSVRSGRREGPDFERGAAVQRLLAACFESNGSGRRVRVRMA
jgi:predicted dehydrogenase